MFLITSRQLFFLGVLCVIILGNSLIVLADQGLEKTIRKEEIRLEQIQKQIEEKKRASKKAVKKEIGLQAEIQRLERQLTEQKKKLLTLTRQLNQTGVEMRKLRSGISIMEHEMTQQQQDIRSLARGVSVVSAQAAAALWMSPVPARMEGQMLEIYLESLLLSVSRSWMATGDEKTRTEGRLTHLEGTYQGLTRSQRQVLRNQESTAKSEEQKRELLSKVKQEKAAYEKEIRKLESASHRVRDLLKAYERSQKETQASGIVQEKGKLPWPLDGKVVSSFGSQKHPEFGMLVERRGIEIAAASAKEVHAIHEGTVIFADWFKGYGKMVIVDHGGKFYSVYARTAQLSVSKGQLVKKGQRLAQVGDSGGDGTAETLYFEIRHGGNPEDPMAWLKPK